MSGSSQRTTILITSIVTLNGGDAAILMAEMDLFKKIFGQEVRFIVYDKHAAEASRYYPEIEFRPWLTTLMYKEHTSQSHKVPAAWVKRGSNSLRNRLAPIRIRLAIIAYKTKYGRLFAKSITSRQEIAVFREFYAADLIVSTGGTYIIPEYGISSRLVEYFLIRNTGNPLVFFTQSIGNLRSWCQRRALRKILRYAQSILVRDKMSESAVQSLIGNSKKVIRRSDAAFYFAQPDLFVSKKKFKSNVFRVVISVRAWQHFGDNNPTAKMQQYCNAIRKFVNHCVRARNAEVIFLSTCQGIRGYVDDSRLANQIVTELDEEVRLRIVVEDRHFNVEELLDILKGFDFAVTTRMHMMILSLCSGVPVIPIAYGFKTSELANAAGLSDLLLDIGDISGEKLIDAFEDAVRRREHFTRTLRASVQKLYRDCHVTRELLLGSSD